MLILGYLPIYLLFQTMAVDEILDVNCIHGCIYVPSRFFRNTI
jgi:hypothetical protein